jgi:hypothetical protein
MPGTPFPGIRLDAWRRHISTGGLFRSQGGSHGLAHRSHPTGDQVRHQGSIRRALDLGQSPCEEFLVVPRLLVQYGNRLGNGFGGIIEGIRIHLNVRNEPFLEQINNLTIARQ